jgi:hypothetical protein
MNDDILCNRFITRMAKITVKTHAKAHRAKLPTPITMVELQNYLNRLVVDSLDMGHADPAQRGNPSNGVGQSNGKRPRNNRGSNGGNGNGGKRLRLDEREDESQDEDKIKGTKRGNMGKGKQRSERQLQCSFEGTYA